MSSRGGENDFARTRPAPRPRDPLGKAALFSGSATVTDISAAAAPSEAAAASAHAQHPSHGRGASMLFSQPEPRNGTVVVDCSGCGLRTRVTYAEFVALHVPVWLWIPSPGRTHRHWLRCPTCRHFNWLRAHWLE